MSNPNPSKKKSLSRLVEESQLYDWNPGRRFLLVVLAEGTRRHATNEDGTPKWVPEDSPYTAEEMVGWCDFAQWHLAIRVGQSTSIIQRDLKQFKEDGVIEKRGWVDNNGTKHTMYKLNLPVLIKNQRPSQTKNVERPKRYKESNPNRGKPFSKTNQPNRAKPEELKAEAAGD